MAPSQYSSIKNIQNSAEIIRDTCKKKLESLLADYDKKAKTLISDLPDISILVKLKTVSPKLRMIISENHAEDSIISIPELLGCLEKIKKYFNDNLELACNIITLKKKQMVRETDLEISAKIKLLRLRFNDHLRSVENLNETDRFHLLPTGWSVEDLSHVIPSLKLNSVQYTTLITEEEENLEKMRADCDVQLEKKKKIDEDSKNMLNMLKNVISDSWMNSQGIAYHIAIRERKDFLQKIEAHLHEFIEIVEQHIRKIDEITEMSNSSKKIIEDYKSQYDLQEEFISEMLKCKQYRKELFRETQVFLNYRETSSKIAAFQLNYDHRDFCNRVERDELISKFTGEDFFDIDLQALELVSNESINSLELTTILRESFISPLDNKHSKTKGHLQASIPKLHTKTQAQSDLASPFKEFLNSARSSPIVSFPVTKIEMQKDHLEHFKIPRRPIVSPAKFQNLDNQERQVSFSIDYEEESGSIVNKLLNTFRVGFKKLIPTKMSKFEASSSRRSSYATAPEIPLEDSAYDARENNRLGELFLKNEDQKNYIQKVIELNKNLREKEKRIQQFEVSGTNIKHSRFDKDKIMKWFEEQKNPENIISDSSISNGISFSNKPSKLQRSYSAPKKSSQRKSLNRKLIDMSIQDLKTCAPIINACLDKSRYQSFDETSIFELT